MKISTTKNIGKKQDFKIELSEGENTEIRINASPVFTATVAVGSTGTLFIYYQEDIS